jgi:hypothetical protein
MNNIETGILAIEAGSGAITNGIYVNEAARDAAITSPTEGMRVYLTAPTVPAATGSVTVIPTGVQTIYNGSVWVCVTEVGSASVTATTGTNGNSSYSAYWTSGTGDTTTNSVTLVTGTTAIVTMTLGVSLGGANSGTYLSATVSGATTLPSSDANSVWNMATSGFPVVNGTLIFTGLTVGTNTFTLTSKGSSSLSATYTRRQIFVRGIA